MLRGAQLRRAVETCPLTAFRGRLCRRVPLTALLADFPNFDFLFASANASRFLRKRTAAALYGSESEETANAEFRYYQTAIWSDDLPVFADHSATFSFEADVQKVLDLTEPRIREHFRISGKELTTDWNRLGRRLPAPTQVLRAASFGSGRVAAIRYPSARHAKGVNLVLFKDRIVNPMRVTAEFTHANGVRQHMRWPERAP